MSLSKHFRTTVNTACQQETQMENAQSFFLSTADILKREYGCDARIFNSKKHAKNFSTESSVA